jgi:hypothetical protein
VFVVAPMGAAVGFMLLVIGFPALAVSLIGGGATLVRTPGVASRVAAGAMLLVAIPVALYGLVLILSVFGVIHLM